MINQPDCKNIRFDVKNPQFDKTSCKTLIIMVGLCQKGGESMKNSVVEKAFKKVIEKTLIADANRTSCTIVYQPKAPAKLEKFKKENR